MLDFSALTKAITSLSQALQAAAALPDDLLVRDGCIQRFEYTYELSVKYMRRQLEALAVFTALPDFLFHAESLSKQFAK